ncbi:unnamed protein product [Oreochromis niloticus]|nr:unnamed protein product [Mustela putorius furo]
MTAGTALLCCTLLFVLVFVSADQKIVTAESGQDVTLTCRVPNNNIAKWSRADLVPQYVLLYRDGYFDPSNQHPSFKNRVDLQDRQMKDGDVSLILKDVNTADSGTYVCEFFIEEIRSWKNSIIHLHVVPPEKRIITPTPTFTPPTATMPSPTTSTPPHTSTSLPGSTHTTLFPSPSPPVLSVLLVSSVGSSCVLVLLVLLVLLGKRCLHSKPEAVQEKAGEDDIITHVMYILRSDHQQHPVRQSKETDTAVVYPAVSDDDVSYGQTEQGGPGTAALYFWTEPS